MIATTVHQPSPFRPPKTPLRSLPPPKIAPQQQIAAPIAAPVGGSRRSAASSGLASSTTTGGMNGHAAPFAPGPSAPVHADAGHHQQIGGTMAPMPKSRQMHAPPSALGGTGQQQQLTSSTSNNNNNTNKPPPSFPAVQQSKALPIINKQTGEAVSNPNATAVAASSNNKNGTPLAPSAIEAPLAPFDNEPMLPVGHSPNLKPKSGGLGLGDSDSDMGGSSSTTTRFGASIPAPIDKYADVVISEQSLESMEYLKEEMLSLRHCGDSCPNEWLKFVLSDILPRLAPGTVPHRLKLLKDAPDQLLNQERGGFGSAKSANSVALNAAATLRLRQVKETHQKVMSVLSRITPEKYEALKEELMNLPLRQTDEMQLKQVVEVFFEKAVQEPVYSQLYAALVSHMCHVSDADRNLPREDRDKLFACRMRRELLNKCQEEFTKPYSIGGEEAQKMTETEVDAARRRFKKRLCGNIKFVCELYARTLVTDRVVDNILSILCAGDTDEDYVAEAIATTITSAGSIFSRSKPEEFERHMGVIAKLKVSHPSTRIKFLMMDVEDSRRRGFERKNQVMTQDELDKQQYLDQKKLQEDMDRALKEQNKQHRRQKKTIPSVPSSPVTPSRQMKREKGLGGRLDPHTPTSGPSDLLPPPAPPSPSSPPPFPKTGGLYAAGHADSTASLSSLGGPLAPLTKDQTASRAKDMMGRMMMGSRTAKDTCDAFDELDKVHRMQILTGWLRLASTSTKLFTEREQLPGLFAAFLTAEEDGSDMAPFTSAELSKVLHDWVIVDIDSQQYDNCPRMFLNWAAVIDGASKYNNISAPADTKVDPATILHPGIVNLFLQEYRRQAESSSVLESFAKDVLSAMDSATEHNLAKVMDMMKNPSSSSGGIPKQLSPTVMTLLQRFRPSAHLAYVEAAENSAAADLVAKKLLENSVLKDDLELNLYKVYSSCSPATLVQEAEVAFARRSKSLCLLHNLLKAASAATAVLLPFHARTLQGGASDAFAKCNVKEDRAKAVAISLKSIHGKILSGMSALPASIAEHACGIAVLSEALQHAAFAVSCVTDRSNPSTPNTAQAPRTPSSAAGGLGSQQGIQLEFEQQLTGKLTTKLCDLLVASPTTVSPSKVNASAFVKDTALTAVRGVMGNVQQDVWAVSPPPSLRPVLGSGGGGILLMQSQDLLSSDDLTSMSSSSQLVLNSPTKITPTSTPLHSKAIANSMLNAMAVSVP